MACCMRSLSSATPAKASAKKGGNKSSSSAQDGRGRQPGAKWRQEIPSFPRSERSSCGTLAVSDPPTLKHQPPSCGDEIIF
jgi:hypothetical protein